MGLKQFQWIKSQAKVIFISQTHSLATHKQEQAEIIESKSGSQNLQIMKLLGMDNKITTFNILEEKKSSMKIHTRNQKPNLESNRFE